MTSTLLQVKEERVGIVVSKKGYMNFLEEKTQGWMKRWVVIRRPYILLFRDDKDLVSPESCHVLFLESRTV